MDLLRQLEELPLTSDMTTRKHLKILCAELMQVIYAEVPGDVVELGVFVGTTSVFLHSVLSHLDPTRSLYLYDSFQGLPDPAPQDFVPAERRTIYFEKGACLATRDQLENNIRDLRNPIPIIREGWFKDQEYPEKIAFAFLDGDIYPSIWDSLEKVYPRLSSGGTIAIHDYGWENTPGVEQACQDFLKDKPERITVTEGYAWLRKSKVW